MSVALQSSHLLVHIGHLLLFMYAGAATSVDQIKGYYCNNPQSPVPRTSGKLYSNWPKCWQVTVFLKQSYG